VKMRPETQDVPKISRNKQDVFEVEEPRALPVLKKDELEEPVPMPVKGKTVVHLSKKKRFSAKDRRKKI